MDETTEDRISYIINNPDEIKMTTIDLFDYIRYYARIRQCARADDKKNQCFVELLTKYKQFFLHEDCTGMGNKAEESACKAFIYNNPRYCKDSECSGVYFNLESASCKDDTCLAQAATKTKYAPGCNSLKDNILQTKCMAGATQDDSHCDSLLEDDTAYDDCCMTITDDAQRERCLAYNDEETEEIVEIEDETKEDLSEYYCKVDAECPKNYFCNDDGMCQTNVQEWNPIKYAENKRQ